MPETWPERNSRGAMAGTHCMKRVQSALFAIKGQAARTGTGPTRFREQASHESLLSRHSHRCPSGRWIGSHPARLYSETGRRSLQRIVGTYLTGAYVIGSGRVRKEYSTGSARRQHRLTDGLSQGLGGVKHRLLEFFESPRLDLA